MSEGGREGERKGIKIEEKREGKESQAHQEVYVEARVASPLLSSI